MKRLAIITTHPIQYNAPLFKMLTDRGNILIKVFYTWDQSINGKKFDPGFNKNIEWDIPLLAGYDYTSVKNISKKPGSHHYKGVDNPSLVKEVNDWNPDGILVFGWNFKSHLNAIRFFHKKIKVLFRGDSTLLNEKFGPRKLLRRIVLKWIYKHIDYALYVGSENKNYFLKHSVSNEKLVFAPHSIDNQRFQNKDFEYREQAEKFRGDLGVSDNECLLLFAGKLEPVKNVDYLIESFRQVSNDNFHLLIVGNGSLESSLKFKYSEVRNLHFWDFQNQSVMPSIYNMCDIFVLPSLNETWGLSINEAMACGKPVIISNKCGCRNDLVIENVNGFIFDLKNKNDLKDKILRIENDKDKLKQMGKESLKLIDSWSYNQVCKAIEKLVNTTICQQ